MQRRLNRSQCDVRRCVVAPPLRVGCELPSVEGKTLRCGCLAVPLDLLEEGRGGA